MNNTFDSVIFCNNKRFNTLDNYFKRTFGSKIAKVPINGGFTCPNRDGKLSYGGCIYCSPMASGDFAGNVNLSITEQFYEITEKIKSKWDNVKYIPYFQAGTNTYAPTEVLREKFEEALSLPDCVGLSISTRPDCITDETLDYLCEINERTFLQVELGLQTIHDKTAKIINRHHTYEQFYSCYMALKNKGINVCIHLINGLPGEDREMMLENVRVVNSLSPHSVKLHMLHILKDTVAEKMYYDGKITCFEKEDYINLVCDQLEMLDKNIVIERITGDGSRENLIAPLWSIKKFDVINGVDKELIRRNSFQGIYAGQKLE